VGRAVAHANRLLVLAPKDIYPYLVLVGIHGFTRDLAALRNLERQLRDAELDLADTIQVQLDHIAGKKAAKEKADLEVTIKRWEEYYTRFKKDGGATFAVAAVTLAGSLMRREEVGEAVDVDRVIRLAEEAHAAAPSRQTQSFLADALLFRTHRQLIQQEPEYAKMATRARRALEHDDLIVVAVERGGKLRTAALADPSLRRACDLLKEQARAFPDEAGPGTCILLQVTDPTEAAPMIESLGKNESGKLARAIALKLAPANPRTALAGYWALKLEGKEAEGKAILKACAARGVPFPFDLD
jgi:hypothetical protein